MAQKKQKFYVVWNGVTPGIYESWTDCQLQIKGFKGAIYKSFETREEAEQALATPSSEYLGQKKKRSDAPASVKTAGYIPNSLAVDAACSGNPGLMEYRGVYTGTGQEIFHVGPLKQGTNNIGEFLAIVHALALCEQKGLSLPIYSDSRNAILWVRKKKCQTKLKRTQANTDIFNLIERAEKWLNSHEITQQILKWQTAEWGEIIADFGRK